MEKKYEIAYVFSVDKEGSVEVVRDSVRTELKELRVNIEKENDMGVRDFAYPIRKQESGHYYVLTVSMTPAIAHSLDGHYRHNDAVLRHLVIRLEK